MMSSKVGQSEDYSEPHQQSSSVHVLPSGLRLLCLSQIEPSWINLTLQLDREGCHEPHFRWMSDAASALSLLREESFDCLLVGELGETSSNQTGQHERAVEFLRAVRASGCDDPAIYISRTLDDHTQIELISHECAALVVPTQWESRALVSCIKRELIRKELIRENHRLVTEQNRRLVRERDEAQHLLDQQRRMIKDLGGLISQLPFGSASNGRQDELTNHALNQPWKLPSELNDFYTELLRTYVIMGSGSLGDEIAQLAELIAKAELTMGDALRLHIQQVESLVQGLGNRSSRHVMARADLLALELMIHLGDCYHRGMKSR
ncbi:MAG: hypothetical protein Tsb009_19010 [Planctomycetaceae bacterium]